MAQKTLHSIRSISPVFQQNLKKNPVTAVVMKHYWLICSAFQRALQGNEHNTNVQKRVGIPLTTWLSFGAYAYACVIPVYTGDATMHA